MQIMVIKALYRTNCVNEVNKLVWIKDTLSYLARIMIIGWQKQLWWAFHMMFSEKVGSMWAQGYGGQMAT